MDKYTLGVSAPTSFGGLIPTYKMLNRTQTMSNNNSNMNDGPSREGQS